ncbi:Predicted protein [Taphrina deformans PYCC 5710]|uniref:RRM domain-containing protein n=1 Tax=Taphrina deformans (strain PYCC 5710 / ATCC 11124 / CBS 356.35 / IMI 108563 / JCM 9778 / NBRC 8474) TaxID=1097556 RepID=R4X7A6_TAPDE|nr:Predicted protein [Taphrina deformans PYCC 5710]|eukprot:CCG81212.1 Predicted protein [Taphrina deformans PYCC 5710]
MVDLEQQVSKRKRKAQESWQTKKADKKNKVAVENEDVPINPLVGEAPKPSKKKTKSVATTTEDGEDSKTVGSEEVETKAQKNKRFILFLGNLSFKTTREEVEAHIAPTGVKPLAIRFQTDAVTKKPKGFAFVDLPDFMSLDKVLNLHHTTLGGRKINVELTAGGGGSGEKRKSKIAKKNEKLDVERETAQKTRREAEAKKVRTEKVRGARGGKNSKQENDEEAKVKELEMADINPARRKRIG